MRTDWTAERRQFEPGNSSRVTRLGDLLRNTKLDELPELFNVLFGEMSLVGPRPEVEKYVKMFLDDFRQVLRMKPGLSDFASITYRNEEEILAKEIDPDAYYRTVVLPDKLRLAKMYVRDSSLMTDIKIIGITLKSIFGLSANIQQHWRKMSVGADAPSTRIPGCR